MNTEKQTEYGEAQNVIDCRTKDKTVIGPWAHDLYFRGGYITEQAGRNLFAIYYIGEEKSELRACQSTLKGALNYMGSYCALVLLKPKP